MPTSDAAPDEVTITATVGEYNAQEAEIVLEQPVNGYERVVIGEEDAEKNSMPSQLLSRDGGSETVPVFVEPGDAIEVRGRPGEDGTLIARTVWNMEAPSEFQRCEGE